MIFPKGSAGLWQSVPGAQVEELRRVRRQIRRQAWARTCPAMPGQVRAEERKYGNSRWKGCPARDGFCETAPTLLARPTSMRFGGANRRSVGALAAGILGAALRLYLWGHAAEPPGGWHAAGRRLAHFDGTLVKPDPSGRGKELGRRGHQTSDVLVPLARLLWLLLALRALAVVFGSPKLVPLRVLCASGLLDPRMTSSVMLARRC